MQEKGSETPVQLLLALEPPVEAIGGSNVVRLRFGADRRKHSQVAQGPRSTDDARSTALEESRIIESVLAQARRLSW